MQTVTALGMFHGLVLQARRHLQVMQGPTKILLVVHHSAEFLNAVQLLTAGYEYTTASQVSPPQPPIQPPLELGRSGKAQVMLVACCLLVS